MYMDRNVLTWHITSRIVATRILALFVIYIKDDAETYNAFRFENIGHWNIAWFKMIYEVSRKSII